MDRVAAYACGAILSPVTPPQPLLLTTMHAGNAADRMQPASNRCPLFGRRSGSLMHRLIGAISAFKTEGGATRVLKIRGHLLYVCFRLRKAEVVKNWGSWLGLGSIVAATYWLLSPIVTDSADELISLFLRFQFFALGRRYSCRVASYDMN